VERGSQGKGTYIHDPAVDISKLLETEQPRSMRGVIESEALQESAQEGGRKQFLLVTVVA